MSPNFKCLLLLSRLAYPVWILNDLFDGMVDSTSLSVHMLYDVACLLERHLQVCTCLLKFAVVYCSKALTASRFILMKKKIPVSNWLNLSLSQINGQLSECTCTCICSWQGKFEIM